MPALSAWGKVSSNHTAICGRQSNPGQRQIWPLKEASLVLLLSQTSSLQKKRGREDWVFPVASKGPLFHGFIVVVVVVGFLFFVFFLLKNTVKILQVWFPGDSELQTLRAPVNLEPVEPGQGPSASKSFRSLLKTESTPLLPLIPDLKHPFQRIF